MATPSPSTGEGGGVVRGECAQLLLLCWRGSSTGRSHGACACSYVACTCFDSGWAGPLRHQIGHGLLREEAREARIDGLGGWKWPSGFWRFVCFGCVGGGVAAPSSGSCVNLSDNIVDCTRRGYRSFVWCGEAGNNVL